MDPAEHDRVIEAREQAEIAKVREMFTVPQVVQAQALTVEQLAEEYANMAVRIKAELGNNPAYCERAIEALHVSWMHAYMGVAARWG